MGSDVTTSRLDRLRAAVTERPDSAKARTRLGTALLTQKSIVEGEAELLRAVELDPNCVEAWVNLGGARLSRWDFQGCVDANRKAAACNPDLIQPHYNQGLGHLYLKQPQEMVDCFERVVKLEPDHPGGNYHMAVGLVALDRIEEAQVYLAKAQTLGYSPKPELIKAIQRELAAKPSTPTAGAAKDNPNQ